MLKRTFILLTLVSAVGAGFPSAALAGRTIAGRITAYSATSLSVIDKEVLTVAIDNRTGVHEAHYPEAMAGGHSPELNRTRSGPAYRRAYARGRPECG